MSWRPLEAVVDGRVTSACLRLYVSSSSYPIYYSAWSTEDCNFIRNDLKIKARALRTLSE